MTLQVGCNYTFFLSSRNLFSQSQQFPSLFLFLVATSIRCRDIIYVASYVSLCFNLSFMSRPKFHIATWLFLFLAEIYVTTLKACRDINFSHSVATSLLSHKISNCTSHSYCRDINFRSRSGLESPTYIFVAT